MMDSDKGFQPAMAELMAMVRENERRIDELRTLLDRLENLLLAESLWPDKPASAATAPNPPASVEHDASLRSAN